MSRIKTNFAVAESGKDSQLSIIKEGLDDTQSARRWLKQNGDDGKTYRIVAIKGQPIEVEVENIKRRTLFEEEKSK